MCGVIVPRRDRRHIVELRGALGKQDTTKENGLLEWGEQRWVTTTQQTELTITMEVKQ